MTEIGFVNEVKNGITTVRVAKRSACGENCASCKGGCTPGERILEVKNPIGAKPGERVALELPEGRLISAAFLVYILPLILFIAGYFLTGIALGAEWQMIAGGAVLSAVGFFGIRAMNEKIRYRYMAEITKIYE